MSNSVVAFHTPRVRATTLWISDEEVRLLFRGLRIKCTQTTGRLYEEAEATFVREQRSNEGTLGYVFQNPISRQNWLWVINKKTRQPFALARVN